MTSKLIKLGVFLGTGLAAGLCLAKASPIQVSVESGKGLTVSVNGVPVIQGSGIQFYAPGWTKGYYSTTYNWQNVQKVDENHYEVNFKSTDGTATGTESYLLKGNQLVVTAHLAWKDPRPCQIEFTAGQIWGNAVLASPYSANGESDRHFGLAPRASVPQSNRALSDLTKPMTVSGGWGSMEISVQNPGTNWTVFDARNWPQDWTQGKEFLWFGAGGLAISPEQDVNLAYTLTFSPTSLNSQAPAQYSLTVRPNAQVVFLPDVKIPLVPFPKQHDFSSGDAIQVTGAWHLPVGHFLFIDDFFKTLQNRFTLPAPTSGTQRVEFDGGLGDLHLPAEAFTIKITKSGISVLGQDDNGLRYGLRRLALLAFSKNGKVYLPVGTLTDWPTVKWRGFHLFAGPDAQSFQSKLFDRVLGPLGFNHAVIQCERTHWDAMPNLKGKDVMSKADLSNLFKMYRTNGVDPIPLIESFGHDEWIFENGANLDLAVNPNQPWALDPRKAGTAPLIQKIWREAIDLLHPDMIHFGCDEVDMESFPEGKDLLTELWPMQMKTLAGIAEANNVKMMIWGDDLLAKGQAPDATNAPSLDVAAERLKSVPPGTWIADWHYAGNPNYNAFMPSLSYWQSKGMVPVASTWYTPTNVSSFDAAAAQAGAGTLQTTWCGYVSADENVVDAFDQFAAFVLASEYSWSGRQDPPDKLEYNFRKLFWRLYFQGPLAVRSTAGLECLAADPTEPLSIGRYRFAGFSPIVMASGLDPAGEHGPTAANLQIQGSSVVSQVVIAAYTAFALPANGEAGKVTIHLADGTTVEKTIQYGVDVLKRGSDGVAPLSENGDGQFAIVIDLPHPGPVKSIDISADSSAAGLTVNGISFVTGAAKPLGAKDSNVAKGAKSPNLK